MNQHFWLVTISLCLLSILTRLFPFVAAKYISLRVQKLGQILPAYIMMLIVLYQLDLSIFFKAPYGLPELIALAGMICCFLKTQRTLLSILLGTLLFSALHSIVLNYFS